MSPLRLRSSLSTPRHTVRWGVTHGLVRAFQARAARQGDEFARLMREEELRADPYPVYESMRRHGPLFGRTPFLATTSHGIASALLRSDDAGVAVAAELPRPIRDVVERTTTSYDLGPVDPPSLLALDPPDHTRLRRLVARGFTARRVAGMQDGVGARTRALLDALSEQAAAGQEVDLVTGFAARLPVAVIADVLGVPEDDRGQLLGWGNEAARLLDSGLGLAEFLRSTAAITDLHHWVERHLERLREEPGEDLLSGLLRTVEDAEESERPTPLELRAVALLVLGAGFETTVNLIGNAIALFEDHPDQLHRCLADPTLWPQAVEEVLRYDPPVQFTARMVKRPTTLADRSLARGDTVVVVVGAANRDPDVFPDPGRFDVTRPHAGEHLSFSVGAHFCIGAQLARLEAAVALRELYTRFPGLTLTGPRTRRTTRVLRGYEHLPARLTR